MRPERHPSRGMLGAMNPRLEVYPPTQIARSLLRGLSRARGEEVQRWIDAAPRVTR